MPAPPPLTRRSDRGGRLARHLRRWRAVLPAALVIVAGSCGPRTAPPPQPGEMRGTPPDLRGRSVIVLPFQQVAGVSGDPDAELAFALEERGRDIEWIDESRLREVLARSPGIDTRTRGLPVGHFLLAEVRRVGDPLYGQLRRMAALVGGEAVLLPIAASYEPNAAVVNSGPRVRLTMALIEPRSGRVVWFGVEEGGEYERGDPRALATAVQSMARTLLWYAGD